MQREYDFTGKNYKGKFVLEIECSTQEELETTLHEISSKFRKFYLDTGREVSNKLSANQEHD